MTAENTRAAEAYIAGHIDATFGHVLDTVLRLIGVTNSDEVIGAWQELDQHADQEVGASIREILADPLVMEGARKRLRKLGVIE